MSNRFFPGLPVSIDFEINVDDESSAVKFGTKLWNAGAYVAYTPARFAHLVAEYAATAADLTNEQALRVRRRVADAIAPNEDIQFEQANVVDDLPAESGD